MSHSTEREATILNAALLLPASQRPAYLDLACSSDAALRQQIEKLLQASEAAGDFLEGAAPGLKPREATTPDAAATVHARAQAEKAGDRIGHYKLLQQIGEGGCGVVYMAEQEAPVRRRVALKVIKLGMDTKQVVGRFEAERQVLALMDHPHIAKVFDAGATDAGRPYFVMELVRGVKITDYCDQGLLSTPQRLELFVQVCQAVQHAHQKGIIHRDLKPSNILVTVNDGVAVPKVIDFGIAKATQGRLTDQTVFTAFEQFIGTPAYMSPEQAVMTSLDIDTRSDIYSLGVLLYELLTGQTPFEARQLLAAGLDEMRRTICEQEPVRPSTRLSGMQNADLTTTAKCRQTDPPRLMRQVRGDLDWIVMKCLEKDRARRYETANGLGRDIQRFLNDEPVTVVAPSAAYRLRKFVRRHRRMVMGTGFVALAILGGIAGTTWGLVRALHQEHEAEHQARIAKHTTDFLTGMFESIDPAQAKLREITVREVMDQAGSNIATAFPNDPLTEMPIRRTMTEIYTKLGRDDLALPQAEAALQLAKIAHGAKDDRDVAQGLDAVATALQDLGRSAEALPQYEAALAMYQRLHKGDDPDLADCQCNLGLCLNALGRPSDALPRFEEALAMNQRIHKEDHSDVADSFANLALCLDALGRATEALTNYEAALAMIQRLHKGDHPEVATCLDAVAICLHELGRPAEAVPKLEAALAMRQRIFPRDHPDVAVSLNNLANCLKDSGSYSEALPKLEAALAMRQRIFPVDHPDVAEALNSLASCLDLLGRSAEALPKYEAALDMYRRIHQGDHPDVALLLNNIAASLYTSGRPADALPRYEAALAMYQRIDHADHPFLARNLNNLGNCLDALGRPVEALTNYEAALAMRQRIFPGDHPEVAVSLNNIARCLTELGRYPDALSKLETALAMRQRIYQGDQFDVADSLASVGTCLNQLDRTEQSSLKYQATMAMLQRLLEAQPANDSFKILLANTLRGRGDLLVKTDHSDGGRQDYQNALHLVESLLANNASNSLAQKLRLSLRLRLGLEEAQVAVLEAAPGGQAQRLGLQKGDVIVAYAGERITSTEQFLNLSDHAPAAETELEIRRDGQPLKFTVKGSLGVVCEDRSLIDQTQPPPK